MGEMIEFDNLSFCYEGANSFALREVNMTIRAGEFILLTGRSGSGKTTLIRCLNGLIPHFHPGQIKGGLRLNGRSLIKTQPSQLAGKIGTVFQDPRSQFFMTDTTRELAFGCENMGYQSEETVRRIAKAVQELQLEDYLNQNIFSLSSGEKQQIAIGSVYALAPGVYIFDEPSANLDYAAAQRLTQIMKHLKESGCIVIVAEHRFYYFRDLIDRVYIMREGMVEYSCTGKEFCSLDEHVRTAHGLRTAYPEKDIMYASKKMPSGHSKDGCLEVSGLSFFYSKKKKIINNLNFRAAAGDVVGILGHNGTGKTTLISILSGLLKEKAGRIRYNGKPLSPRKRRALSYLVMQDSDYQLFGSSVKEELTLGLKETGEEQVRKTLKLLGLLEYRERHPASLSGGQKQRVTIGAAIVKESPVIYFDEPTSGLDADSMIRVSGLIRELSAQGIIIFVVSHDFEFIVRTCTKVMQLKEEDFVCHEELTPEILRDLSQKYFRSGG